MLYIVLLNLKNFIVRQKGIFTLFIVSQLVTTLSVMFVYSVVVFQNRESLEHNLAVRTFAITLPAETDNSLDDRLADVAGRFGDGIRDITALTGEDNHIHAEYTFPDRDSLYVSYGAYFLQEDYLAGERQIIISQWLAPDLEVGDSFPINGVDFAVIGIFANREYHEIPFAAVSGVSRVNQVLVIMEDVPSTAKIGELISAFQTVFGDARIQGPTPPDPAADARHLFTGLIAMGVGLLAVTNYSYLYRYMLMKRRQQYAALKISGCSVARGVLIYLSEILLLSITQFILSALAFHSAVAPYFSRINEYLRYLMTPGDYIVLAGIYLTVVLAIFGPMIWNYSRQSPRELWRAWA